MRVSVCECIHVYVQTISCTHSSTARQKRHLWCCTRCGPSCCNIDRPRAIRASTFAGRTLGPSACVCLCRCQCRCRYLACACAGVGARRLVLGTGLSAGFNSKILHRYTDTHAHLMYACMYACSSHRHHSPDQVVIPPDVCTPDQVCPKHICNVCVCIYTCVCVCVYRHAHRHDVYTFRSLSSGRALT